MNWYKTTIPTEVGQCQCRPWYLNIIALLQQLADYLVSEGEGHDDEAQAEVRKGEGSNEPVLERSGHSQSKQ